MATRAITFGVATVPAYWLNRTLGVEWCVAGPSALIGASNFFELAVATAIVLFGFQSGAALATVVGVLVEPRVAPADRRQQTLGTVAVALLQPGQRGLQVPGCVTVRFCGHVDQNEQVVPRGYWTTQYVVPEGRLPLVLAGWKPAAHACAAC